MNSSEVVGTIDALWRFPVKSMQGERVDAADVGDAGVIGDRVYALVDRKTGKVAARSTQVVAYLLAPGDASESPHQRTSSLARIISPMDVGDERCA
jgi:uncharacterized protein YcbX